MSLGLQGMGSAATYLGSLLYMMKSCIDSGLPDSEQTNGMVSSLWVVSDCFGSYIGSTLGSVAFDNIGFEKGTMVESGAMAITVLLLFIYICWKKGKTTDPFSLRIDVCSDNEDILLMNEIKM